MPIVSESDSSSFTNSYVCSCRYFIRTDIPIINSCSTPEREHSTSAQTTHRTTADTGPSPYTTTTTTTTTKILDPTTTRGCSHVYTKAAPALSTILSWRRRRHGHKRLPHRSTAKQPKPIRRKLALGSSNNTIIIIITTNTLALALALTLLHLPRRGLRGRRQPRPSSRQRARPEIRHRHRRLAPADPLHRLRHLVPLLIPSAHAPAQPPLLSRPPPPPRTSSRRPRREWREWRSC